MNRALPALSIAAMTAVACGPSIAPMTGLPIAELTCPTSGEVGAPFTVDPSTSHDDEGPFALVELDVNGDKRTELAAQSFSVDYAGIVVAALKVTDQSQNVATATCRFVVGGSAPDDIGPGDDEPVGDDPAGDDPAGDDPAGDDPVGDDDDPLPEPAPESLTGSFAMVAYDMPQLEGGGLDPALQCMPAPSLALVELVEGAGELTMTLTWCHLEIPDVQLTGLGVQDNEIPDSTTQYLGSLGPATFPFDGSVFAPPLDVFGRALVAGATNSVGPLPDNDDADNVSNPDGDDNQGVPIFAGSLFPIQLNVAMRRTISALSGSVVSTSEIDGSTDGSYRAHTEIGLLDSGMTMFAQPETSTALPSRFKLTRVDDGATCANIIARQGTLLASLSAPELPDGCYMPPQE